jgi:hypothetical protein
MVLTVIIPVQNVITNRYLVTDLWGTNLVCMSVRTTARRDYQLRPSAYNSAPTKRIFSAPTKWISMKFDTSVFFESLPTLQVSLKSVKNYRHFTWRPMRIYNILLSSSKNEECRVNQNRHLNSNDIFRKSRRLWVNVEKYGTARQATDGNIIRRMRVACWITKATDTHSEQATLIVFAVQQWLCERASVLRHTDLAYLVKHSLQLTSGFKSLMTDGDIRERRCMKSRSAQTTRLATYSQHSLPPMGKLSLPFSILLCSNQPPEKKG